MSDKNLILVFYVNIESLDSEDVPAYLKSTAEKMDLAKGGATTIIIPTRSGESRLECINPILLTEEEYAKARQSIEKIEQQLAEFMKGENKNIAE